MTRAKSLVSLHLCSNPGSTVRVKDYLQRRVRCMQDKPIIKFPADEILSLMKNHVTKNILQRQLTLGAEGEGEKPVARETIKIKQIMERKRIHSLVNEFSDDNASDSRMIFTRILGHK